MDFFCDNCSSLIKPDDDFCPVCEIPVTHEVLSDNDYFICPVCEAKNPKGERKCKYCCSIL